MTAAASHPAEQAVAGLALIAGGRTADAILDRCTPQDFDHPLSHAVMDAVADLRSNGNDPSVRAVTERLRHAGKLDALGGDHAIDALTAHSATAGSVQAVVADVARMARDRRRAIAARTLHASVGDEQAWEEALRGLHNADGARTRGGWVSPEQVANKLIDSIHGGDPTRYPWPLERLNRLAGGGVRRGQVTFIGGVSSHGKSAYLDAALHSMGMAGARTGLFLNEMTVEERAERIAARLANVRYSRIQTASAGLTKLDTREATAIVEAMASQPVGMVPCAGWTVEQIVREARRRRLDVMALDIVQKLPFTQSDRRLTLEDAVQRLDAFAKDTGCHVLIVGQVNRARASQNGTFPVPGLADIKDCAELGNGPDNVLFVWRQQDPDTLDPMPEGVLRMAKYRGARLETLATRFVGEFQRWEERLLVAGERAIAA